MNDTVNEIRKLSSQGHCCSQILIKMALDSSGDENPELVNAVAGLCGGLYSGLCCGTLTGGACLLSMYDKEKAKVMIPSLVEWFKRTYTEAYGGIDCCQIMDDNPMNRIERCPKIMAETYEKCRELLGSFGYEL